MTRRRAPVAGRVADPDVDRILRNHDERLRQLERESGAVSAQEIVNVIQTNTSIFQTVINSLAMVTVDQTITALSDQFLSVATASQMGSPIIHLAVTVPSGLGTGLMAAQPIIAPGTINNQILHIYHTGGVNGFVLRDQSAFANGGLRTQAAGNITIGSRDHIWFSWVAADNRWWQVVGVVTDV